MYDTVSYASVEELILLLSSVKDCSMKDNRNLLVEQNISVLKASCKRLSAQLSDFSLTYLITIYDAVENIEEVTIAMSDISDEKPLRSDDAELATSLSEKVCKTLLAHTAYG